MEHMPKYSSIIDAFLDSREPNWDEIGLKDARDSGDEWLDRTHDESDTDFMDEIAEGASHHTNVPPTSKGATLTNRLLDKENATPRIGANKGASTITAGFNEDDDSLADEITMTFEEAEKGAKLEKKHRSDAEIKKYIHDLLNQGVPPAKVAAQLEKLAELELFNHTMSTRYLQDNAGTLGIAFLEPNTYMDKSNPNYQHIASTSNDCVRQEKAWKAAGIKPRAKSVKKISACEGCSYYKKNASSKSCGLYGLPVVGSASELSAVVNKMTAGVPAKSKKAALVQIANRLPEQNIPVKQASDRVVKTATERTHIGEVSHFSGAKVQQLHAKGHSLKAIQAAADNQFGPIESSRGIKEFIASLTPTKGKLVMAQADADYLKKIGIHNEAIVGASKCASCKDHIVKEVHKASSTDMITRAPQQFKEATLSTVRAEQKKVSTSTFTPVKVAKLHNDGFSLKEIVKAASEKYGTVPTKDAVLKWARGLKDTDTKIALSQIDCTVLDKMGVKLSSRNAIIGQEKCASCSYRSDMHCGLTGGTLISFPGLYNIQSNHKTASGAPEEGRAMLGEYELIHKSSPKDIDMNEPERADIQMSSTMSAGDI